jgi:flagella basal body P-ring formation protein FlgA
VTRELLFAALCLLAPAVAAATPVPESIREAIREVVESRLSTDNQNHELEFPELSGKFGDCLGRLEVSTSQKRLRGKTPFRVRCTSPVWSLNVPVKVILPGDFWVAERFLPAGTVLSEADMKLVSGDLATVPEDVVRSDSTVIGKVVSRSTPAGAVLVLNTLRENTVIKAGERVRVNMLGSGFSVTGEATAMGAGVAGENIKLKTRDGQQLIGRVVKAGLVEVTLE